MVHRGLCGKGTPRDGRQGHETAKGVFVGMKDPPEIGADLQAMEGHMREQRIPATAGKISRVFISPVTLTLAGRWCGPSHRLRRSR